jgi:drug/metabolite transporter (DMT)-like permease
VLSLGDCFFSNMRLRQETLGIVAMLAASLFYLLGDTVVKTLTVTIPASQIIAMRGLMTSLLVMIAICAAGLLREWYKMLQPSVLFRAALDGGATLCFTAALAHMRIADATAVINAAPVAATIVAIRVLREQISLQRWLATVDGFAGVLLVLRPDTSGLNVSGATFRCPLGSPA